MNVHELFPIDRAKTMADAFAEVIELDVKIAEIKKAQDGIIEATTIALGITPKVFRIALRYAKLTPDERDGFSKALEMARAALDQTQTGDLFADRAAQ